MPPYVSCPQMLGSYTCGTIEINEEGLQFIWEVQNVFSGTGEFFRTRSFSFVNDEWYFKVYPNGDIKDDLHENGYVSVYLFRNSSGPPNKIDFTFGLQTIDGMKISKERKDVTFSDDNRCFGFPNYMLKSQLVEKSELSDKITINCSLRKKYM